MTKILKNIKTPYVFAGIALLLSVVFSGGLNWQSCIFSILLLTVSFVKSGGIKKFAISLPLVGLICLCAVSVFVTKTNPQTTIYESYKFMCFVSALAAGCMLSDKGGICKMIFYTSLVVAIGGILACLGLTDAEEFTFKDGGIVRLQSFIKYANVTACFLGCGYLCFLRLFATEEKRIYLYGGSLILTAMYFTFSKACIPLFLVVGTLYACKEDKIRSVFVRQNIISAILLIAMLFLAPERLHFLLFVFIVFGVWVSDKVNGDTKYLFPLWVLFLIVAAFGAVIVLCFRPSFAGTFLIRLQYMKDALKLFPEGFVFGNGMGSWRVLQYALQSEQYNVTYLHNGILQFVVENGIVFTLVFMGLVVYSLVNSFRQKEYHKTAITVLILLHSLIDCDLSFGSVLVLMGLIMGSCFPNKESLGYTYKIFNIMLVGILCVFTLYSLSEYAVRSLFEKSYISEDFSGAEVSLDTLKIICPLDAQLKVSEAAIEEKTTNNPEIIISKLKEATELSPHDPEIYRSYMEYACSEDNIESLCREYIELAPKQESTYAFVKQFIKEHKLNGTVSDETYLAIYSMTEERRIKEKVIDRNKLLKEKIKKERGNEK